MGGSVRENAIESTRLASVLTPPNQCKCKKMACERVKMWLKADSEFIICCLDGAQLAISSK